MPPAYPEPIRPTSLNPLMEQTLAALQAGPVGNRIILGGGIALKHYADFRTTHDIHAWWAGTRDPRAVEQIMSALLPVAAANACEVEHRQFGATDSFEFRPVSGGKAVFSFQIALRDLPLDEPVPSAWKPVQIE